MYRLITGISLLALAACSEVWTTPEKTLIDQAEAQTRERLLDPDTAQFRNVRGSPELQCVTGELLSKNAFGAFTGWQDFVWKANSGAILSAEAPSEVLNAKLECTLGFDLKEFAGMGTEADSKLARSVKEIVFNQLKEPKAALYNISASAASNCVTGKYLLPGQKLETFVWRDGKSEYSSLDTKRTDKEYDYCLKAQIVEMENRT